jgi:hypothetical protein
MAAVKKAETLGSCFQGIFEERERRALWLELGKLSG